MVMPYRLVFHQIYILKKYNRIANQNLYFYLGVFPLHKVLHPAVKNYEALNHQ